jgi:AcrR family transcriptional regulator
MRDLGKELGLLGSSLYSHVSSKQDLLVEVVEEGARLFEESAEQALATEGSAADRLDALIAGHVAVVVDNIDVARTFLNEARMLDPEHRSRIVAARDHYEGAFRAVISEGKADGSLSVDADPKIASIFLLSILNAIERWYDPSGELDRSALVAEVTRFARTALS